MAFDFPPKCTVAISLLFESPYQKDLANKMEGYDYLMETGISPNKPFGVDFQTATKSIPCAFQKDMTIADHDYALSLELSYFDRSR